MKEPYSAAQPSRQSPIELDHLKRRPYQLKHGGRLHGGRSHIAASSWDAGRGTKHRLAATPSLWASVGRSGIDIAIGEVKDWDAPTGRFLLHSVLSVLSVLVVNVGVRIARRCSVGWMNMRQRRIVMRCRCKSALLSPSTFSNCTVPIVVKSCEAGSNDSG